MLLTPPEYTYILVGMLRNRNPDETRERLLDAAMEEMHQQGFQGASLNRILEHTGLTKGALYHHFPTKQALGYAVVEERIAKLLRETWLEPLKSCKDPVTCLRQVITTANESLGEPKLLKLGSLLNNLALETSSLDEGFRQRIQDVYTLWHRNIVEALSRGQGAGTVREDIDCNSTALFLIATIEGAIGMAKNAQKGDILSTTMQATFDYLEHLRAM